MIRRMRLSFLCVKQKTAYEMRISDWSSDVCSSDLPGRTIVGGVALAVLLAACAAIAGVFAPRTPDDWTTNGLVVSKETGQAYVILPGADGSAPEPGRAACRERVW